MNKKKLKNQIKKSQDTQIIKTYSNLKFTIVLVQPETAGNIGFIARCMKNFNFEDLVIFNPIESIKNILSHETQGYAMHGSEIVLNAKIIEISDQENHIQKYFEYMNRFDLIVATTAKGIHYRNIRRRPIFIEDLNLPVSKKSLHIALVFGKESRGLTNEEIEIADILVRIPANEDYPTLNVSHACSIILYEINKKRNISNLDRGDKPILLANKEDRRILYQIINNIIKKLKVRTHKKENVLFSFKNVFERAIMTKKELSLILGVLSKLDSILNNLNLYQKIMD
ncbi:MAG: RNA methyltransferase [Candidatus Heimdallarchaeota archaeon]